MSNSHDEIKKLLKASQMLLNPTLNEESHKIKLQHGLLTEQGVELTNDVDFRRDNIGSDIEDDIEDEISPKKDKRQGYRISGGVIVLHGKDKTDLDLTGDEKTAFQETMDEFVEQVSDMVDFNKLNVYPNNVEWSGKIIDADLEFFYSIGEDNGVYINGDMIKTDDDFIERINKLKTFYEIFKSKWAKILASRKKTKS
jgi:hypothetical protein